MSKKYQRYGCNYVIVLNKKDSDLFMGKEKVKKLIEDEIEHIKTARSNEGQESENEEDYLKVGNVDKFRLIKQGLCWSFPLLRFPACRMFLL